MSRAYYLRNRERLLAWQRAWHHANKKRRREYLQRASKTERFRERVREYMRGYRSEYRAKNLAKIRAYHRTYARRRRAESISVRIAEAIRASLRSRISGKNLRPISLLGCSVKQLKLHLEWQFKDGMSWSNYGLNGWHIDHIEPLASFDLTDPAQLSRACHFTNLQPLWAHENRAKGAS